MQNIRTETDNAGKVVRLSKPLEPDLELLQKQFGLKNIADANRYASKVGLRVFKKNPSQFLKLISDN